MATEHHVKEVKGPGGVKNVIQKEPALVHWSLIRHITGEFSSCLRALTSPPNKFLNKHQEHHKSAMKHLLIM